MNNLPVPPPLAAPFAQQGDKSTLPVSSSGHGSASLLQGFPPETSLPLSSGGIPPSREDMNALGYAASFPQYYLQAGGYYTYDANVASAIGGYPIGAILDYYNSSGGARRLRSVIPNNMHNFVTSPSVIGTYWKDITPVAGGRGMFEFFWHFSTEPPEGALVLDGQVLTGCNNQNSPYYKFYTKGKELANAGNLAVAATMARYEQDITNFGECGSFVFDQALDGTPAVGNMRIPTIRHFIQAGTPGGIHSAGLPNISGSFPGVGQNYQSNPNYHYTATGAFRTSNTTNNPPDGVPVDNGEARDDVIAFNANSGATVKGIYGGANTVQPQSVELVPCIQYAPAGGSIGGGGGIIDPADMYAIAREVVESESHVCVSSYTFSGGFGAHRQLTSGGTTYWAETELTASGLMIRRSEPGGDLGLRVKRGAIVTPAPPENPDWKITTASIQWIDLNWKLTSVQATQYSENIPNWPDDLTPETATGASSYNYTTGSNTSSGESPWFLTWPDPYVNGMGAVKLVCGVIGTSSSYEEIEPNAGGSNVQNSLNTTFDYYSASEEEEGNYTSTRIEAAAAAYISREDAKASELSYGGSAVTSITSDMWVHSSATGAPEIPNYTVYIYNGGIIQSQGMITVYDNNGALLCSGYPPFEYFYMMDESIPGLWASEARGTALYVSITASSSSAI